MEQKNLSKLNEQELLQEEKNTKIILLAYQILTGLVFVAAIYSATHKGSLIISFLPFAFLYYYKSVSEKYENVKKEKESRQSQ